MPESSVAALEKPAPEKRRRDIHPGDVIFSNVLRIFALALPVVLILIALFLLRAAWPSITRFGFAFVTSSVWDPVREIFGSAPVIYGTIVSSLLAIGIGGPIGVGIALALTDLLPRTAAKVLGFLVEMLAAIPSVVYGLWGIFVLAPWLRTTVEPFLAKTLGFLPFFQGPAYGVGMLAAGVILAIMIIPTISSLSREVFNSIPRAQREAALAIGATRWEMMRLSVLGSAKSGVFGAIILGLGRALGETMAVTMVIGNRAQISASLFAPGQTMSSVLANEYAEATSDFHLAALMEIGLVLFAVTFIINALARLFVWRSTLGRSPR
ncbi:MAG: phosphate ABC transporter permease subunit PstC [Bacteriovoracia bacterium]